MGKKKEIIKDAEAAFEGMLPVIRDLQNEFDIRVSESEKEVRARYSLLLQNDSGFFFGTEQKRSAQGKYIGKPSDKDGHILCVGESGRGKSQGLVIPTLKTWKGHQIVLDVKGDMADYWRKLNGYSEKKLKVFNPGSSESLRYDPFAPLRYGGPDNLAGNAMDLAQTLIPLPVDAREPVWIKTAQTFLTGVIIYHFGLGNSFINTMVDIMSNSVTEMIEYIMQSDDETAKFFINKLSDVQEKVIGNIGMELSNLTIFATDSAILSVIVDQNEQSEHLLDWNDLNTDTDPFDIILNIPEANLERWEPLIRVMVNQLIRSLERHPLRTYDKYELPPVLLMLDEFPRLGKVPAIRNGLMTLRGRGVTIALFVQSIASLKEIYGKSTSHVIIENCSFKAVLGATDVESQQYFSNLYGTRKAASISFNVNHDPSVGHITGYSGQVSETREPIIFPEKFQTMDNIVFFTPEGNCRIEKTLFVDHKYMFLDTAE